MRPWVVLYDPSLESNVEVRNFHWSAVRLKVTVAPKYPTEAKKSGIGGRCQVRFYIDEGGTPLSVDIAEQEDCPSVFHTNALKAANQWRFEPMEADGNAVKATFTFGLRFQTK